MPHDTTRQVHSDVTVFDNQLELSPVYSWPVHPNPTSTMPQTSIALTCASHRMTQLFLEKWKVDLLPSAFMMVLHS